MSYKLYIMASQTIISDTFKEEALEELLWFEKMLFKVAEEADLLEETGEGIEFGSRYSLLEIGDTSICYIDSKSGKEWQYLLKNLSLDYLFEDSDIISRIDMEISLEDISIRIQIKKDYSPMVLLSMIK